jgi:homoserine dehydrogenase
MDIAIIGYGVVGSGVAEVIRKNSRSIEERAGQTIRVKKILDIRKITDGPDSALITNDPEEVFSDPEIGIIVETIGGTRISYEYTKRAFVAKKHVVTSNKELVAAYGPELMKIAAENGVKYLFEASVGGGIPIIRPLNQCLAANVIDSITGILNGTTNYILTQMVKEGRDFEDALKQAQKNGYAEADPTADIEGHDACRKIAILSSIAYNQFVDHKNIHTEGISKITLTDMRYAQSMDSVIKLVAVSKREGDKISAIVAPAIISKNHSLANVDDVFNAIIVHGNAIGDAMFYGRGAGKLPTASAVVADVIDITKHGDNIAGSVWVRSDKNNMVDIGETETKFFIRVNVRNEAEAVKFIDKTFGKVEYIKSVSHKQTGELAFITRRDKRAELNKSIDSFKGIGSIKDIISVIMIIED